MGQDDRVVIVGAGGVGREALDACLAADVSVRAFMDDRLTGGTVRGLPVLRPDDARDGEEYLIGIADPRARRRIAGLLDAMGMRPRTVIHPRAIIAPETTFGPGCLVLGGAHVSSTVTVRRHSQVHYNATIGHDSCLDDFVTVYPGANVSGSVRLCSGATVGSAACVLQGLEVGEDAFVGAGAVVTKSVPPRTVVAGVPARPHG
jgi:sugar O-acyltransferase (sialic acid O-acetyltransferase NeuD family)